MGVFRYWAALARSLKGSWAGFFFQRWTRVGLFFMMVQEGFWAFFFSFLQVILKLLILKLIIIILFDPFYVSFLSLSFFPSHFC